MKAAQNDVMRLNRVLQAIFIAQARDVTRNLTLDMVEADRLPDTSPWIKVMADAVKPILLRQYQLGAAKTAARLGARVNAMPDYNQGLRRYAPGNAAIFGEAKTLTLAGNSPVRFEMSRPEKGQGLRFFKNLRRVVVKAAGEGAALLDFDLFSPTVLTAVDNAVFDFCRETMATATTGLQDAIIQLRGLMREGLPKGDSVAFLAKKVREVFADPMRAFRIATTETSRAMHAGQLDVAEQSGVVAGKTWLASSDACERCLELDGKTVKLREPFWIDPKSGPYARVMYPPLHPHCFCDFTEELA